MSSELALMIIVWGTATAVLLVGYIIVLFMQPPEKG